MGKANLIKKIIAQGMVSEQDALYAISEQIGAIRLHDYFYLVAECKSNGIDANSFFRSIYMNASEEVQYRVKVKLYNKKSNLNNIPFSITAFAGKYVKTELFHFQNAIKGVVIDIATITFRNGRVTPIVFNK